MRRIIKCDSPDCLTTFIAAQQSIEPDPINLTYDDFPRKTELLNILTAEQYGLCGYTGVAVDDRVSRLRRDDSIVYSNHIEHMKSQNACRQELVDNGLNYGTDLADDLNYSNMIAALEIRGAESEHFGAVIKKNHTLPVLPTAEGCEQRFSFQEPDGKVIGLDADACESIKVLQLNHETLIGWRKAAIDAFLDPEIVKTIEDFKAIVDTIDTLKEDKLIEFSFVIKNIAKQYLKS